MKAPTLAAAILIATSAMWTSGCGNRPQDKLTWRESWEILALGHDGDLVDARITVGNTGLLRGQAHLRAERWSLDEAPIIYARDIAPVEVDMNADRTAVRLGYDGLELGEDPSAPKRWTLRARDNTARILLQVDPLEPAPPQPQAWQEGGGQWTLSAPAVRAHITGWVSAPNQGGLVEGYGALLHRGGDGLPADPRRTVLVASADVGVGVDIQGGRSLSWAWLDGQTIPVRHPKLDLREARKTKTNAKSSRRGPSTLHFDLVEKDSASTMSADGLDVELHWNRKIRGRRLLYEHLLGPEQRLMSWIGQWRERRVRRGWARISLGDKEWIAPAAMVEVGPTAWTGHVPSPKMEIPVDSVPTP